MPVVKEYCDFTKAEREQYQRLWVLVLDPHCPADDFTGNHPCDNGVPCDRCLYDYTIQREFAEACVAKGCPIVPRLVRFLKP